MGRATLKQAVSFVAPEGLILLAVTVLTSWSAAQRPLAGFFAFYPYAVFIAGLLLAWRFHRSRLLFTIFVLALADRALAADLGALVERLVFQATAFLLPLNFAALALLPERGTLTRWGVVRLAALLGQAGAVAALAQARPAATLMLLQLAPLPRRWLAWTPLGQPALLAFAAAFVLLALGLLFERGVSRRAFVWSLAACFVALNVASGTPATIYLATAGLILVAAVVEASYVMAYQDGLTGLPARRALNEELLRLGGAYTVAMVDVDHFKRINDSYGHDVGDQVLRMVAAKLATVSAGGRAFRYGGEEFAVVFPGKCAEEILPELERLRQAVQDTNFTVRGRLRPRKKPEKPRPNGRRRRQVSVTVSIGVAEKNDRHANPEAVLQAADRALYRAKQGGRNQVQA